MARQPRKQSGTGIYRKDQGNGSLLKQSEQSSSAIDPFRQRSVPPIL